MVKVCPVIQYSVFKIGLYDGSKNWKENEWNLRTRHYLYGSQFWVSGNLTFEIQTIWRPSCTYHLKTGLFSPDFNCKYKMITKRPVEHLHHRSFEFLSSEVQPSKSPIFKCFCFSKGFFFISPLY